MSAFLGPFPPRPPHGPQMAQWIQDSIPHKEIIIPASWTQLGPFQISREVVVFNRLANPICNTCKDKSDIDALLLCAKCKCTWYCSEKCLEGDAFHKQWCANPDAPPDPGPLRMAIGKIEEPTR